MSAAKEYDTHLQVRGHSPKPWSLNPERDPPALQRSASCAWTEVKSCFSSVSAAEQPVLVWPVAVRAEMHAQCRITWCLPRSTARAVTNAHSFLYCTGWSQHRWLPEGGRGDAGPGRLLDPRLQASYTHSCRPLIGPRPSIRASAVRRVFALGRTTLRLAVDILCFARRGALLQIASFSSFGHARHPYCQNRWRAVVYMQAAWEAL